MGETEPFYQWIATLGLGGVLAAFIFHFYRQDMKENADRIREILDAYKAETAAWKEVVISNTKAMTECTKMTEQVFKYLLSRNQILAESKNDSDNRSV